MVLGSVFYLALAVGLVLATWGKEVDVIIEGCHRQLGSHTDPSIRPTTKDDNCFVRVEVAFDDHWVKVTLVGRLLE